jgi:outer membrane cobalamin receptor
MSPVLVRAVAASCALVLVGCAANLRPPPAPRHSSHVITREDIERSGAVDAYEALKRSSSFLNIGEQKSGDIRVSERGNGSILLSPQILLVVDEVRMLNLNSLKDIRADAVESMAMLSGAEATPVYGTGASNGVLVVRTRIPSDRK